MKLKVLGINDEFTTCDCCGKSNLKCTVALEVLDLDGNGTGEILRYGRDCASKALHGNKSGNVKAVESLGQAITYARKWLRQTERHTAKVVANAIRVRFCRVHEAGPYTLKFDNGVTISA